MRRNLYLSLAGLIVVAHCGVIKQALVDPLDASFAQYMARYGKSYTTKEEYEKRREIFAQQAQEIAELNARNGASYTVGLNKFSDLTREEFESRYLGDSGLPDPIQEGEVFTPVLSQAAPTPIDWRTKGVIGPVKDQGACGSCWSFSTVGPIEEHYAIKYGVQMVFAE